MWLEPMTSAMPVQCSTNLATVRSHSVGSRSICWFQVAISVGQAKVLKGRKGN